MNRRTFVFGGLVNLVALETGCFSFITPRTYNKGSYEDKLYGTGKKQLRTDESSTDEIKSSRSKPVTESSIYFNFPNLDVWSLDGRLNKLSDYYHQNPLLIHTIQYGCTPCKESFPILNELTSKIEVLGLYSGWGEDFATDKREWLDDTRKHRMDFDNVLIANRGDIQLDSYCRKNFPKCIDSFPSYFIIDGKGNCTHYQSGGLTFQDNEAKLREAIRSVGEY
ncbi:hypothetical protein HYU21_02275 [Candidatus Woesearchaeota archaeon]|nr:hypothetical protein [Candidatus Woesearchaeota archaeon]